MRELYKKYIDDITMEISQSNEWRELIKNSEFDKYYIVSKDSILPLPEYIKNAVIKNNLQFYVSKVKECDEEFDDDLIIFKFQSVEYKDIVRYSGNWVLKYQLIKNCVNNLKLFLEESLIKEAYANRMFIRGNRYSGITSNGIEMFLDVNDQIISAYPIY